MKEGSWDEEYPCPCSEKSTKCPARFEKVADLKSSGLVIYRQLSQPKNDKLNTDHVETAAKKLEVDENVFIFYNTNDEDVTSKDFVPEIERRALSCPRCRHIMDHALKILQKVSAISRKKVIGICNHCKLKLEPCNECESAVKKFFEYKKCFNENVFTKDKVNKWLTKFQGEFRGYLSCEKETRMKTLQENKHKFVAPGLSDERINQRGRWDPAQSEHKPVSQMYQEPEGKSFSKISLSETCDMNKRTHLTFDDSLMVIESSVYSISRKVKSADAKLNQMGNHDKIYESAMPSSELEEVFANDNEKLTKIGRTYHYDDIMLSDHLHEHNKGRSNISNKQKPIKKETEADVGIKIDQGNTFQEKYFFHLMAAEPKVEELEKDFSFAFPNDKFELRKYKQEKSSFELVNDVYDRIRQKKEELNRKNDELRLNKIDKLTINEENWQRRAKRAEERKKQDAATNVAKADLLIKQKENETTFLAAKIKRIKSQTDQYYSSPSELEMKAIAESIKLISELKRGIAAQPGSEVNSLKFRQLKDTKHEQKTRLKLLKTDKKELKDSIQKVEQKAVEKYDKVQGSKQRETVSSQQKSQFKKSKYESKTECKLPNAKLKSRNTKGKEEFKSPPDKLRVLNKEPKSGASDSKPEDTLLEAKLKPPKLESKVSDGELKLDSKSQKVERNQRKSPVTEFKADCKQLKAELKSLKPASKAKSDSKVPKTESIGDIQLTAEAANSFKSESMAKIKQPKAELKLSKPELIQTKAPKTETKHLKVQSEQSKSAIETKQVKTSEKPKDKIIETKAESKYLKSHSKSAKALEDEIKNSNIKNKHPKAETIYPKNELISDINETKQKEKKGTYQGPEGEIDILKIQQNVINTDKRNKIDYILTSEKQIKKEEEIINRGKGKTIRDPFESRIPRRQLEAAPLGSEFKDSNKELKANSIKMLEPSQNCMYLDLVKVKGDKKKKRTLSEFMTLSQILKHLEDHKNIKTENCPMCMFSYLELEFESKEKNIEVIHEMIKGRRVRLAGRFIEDIPVNDVIKPLFFQINYDSKFKADIIKDAEYNQVMIRHFPSVETVRPVKKNEPVEETKGVIRYALSDRSFIEKGWTKLPTEKVVRKMNVYRMRPAHPEFDWFERNKIKGLMTYDTGERLAEFDDDGRGRWYYRNQRLALQYYDAEELNAQQRFVIFSNGEPDERGRARPYTILATFDYIGNGIVFDHGGKIRMKYNQTEGVVLDRSIGPASHWQWHTLNDPPVLQQVMIDTQMTHKDPQIFQMGGKDQKVRPDNEDMQAIEFDNFIKEKSKKLSQNFKPFQIKMKALKINEHFSLKVLDQANVYLIFRDGTTNIKLNLGMLLDHREIVDTDTAEVGEVSSNLERFPARTDSLAAMQKSVAYARHFERTRTEREKRLRPPEPSASADELVAATSRPLRLPLRAACSAATTTTTLTPSSKRKCKKPSSSNIYYDNRLC